MPRLSGRTYASPARTRPNRAGSGNHLAAQADSVRGASLGGADRTGLGFFLVDKLRRHDWSPKSHAVFIVAHLRKRAQGGAWLRIRWLREVHASEARQAFLGLDRVRVGDLE